MSDIKASDNEIVKIHFKVRVISYQLFGEYFGDAVCLGDHVFSEGYSEADLGKVTHTGVSSFEDENNNPVKVWVNYTVEAE